MSSQTKSKVSSKRGKCDNNDGSSSEIVTVEMNGSTTKYMFPKEQQTPIYMEEEFQNYQHENQTQSSSTISSITKENEKNQVMEVHQIKMKQKKAVMKLFLKVITLII